MKNNSFQETSYKNSFYNKSNTFSVPFIKTTAKAVLYRGYLIYHRLRTTTPQNDIFDIVKNSVCVGMNAGINGAKIKIDKLIDGEDAGVNT